MGAIKIFRKRRKITYSLIDKVETKNCIDFCRSLAYLHVHNWLANDETLKVQNDNIKAHFYFYVTFRYQLLNTHFLNLSFSKNI